MRHNNKWARAIAKDLLEQGWSAEEAKNTFDYFGKAVYRIAYFMEVLKK